MGVDEVLVTPPGASFEARFLPPPVVVLAGENRMDLPTDRHDRFH